MPWVPEMFTSQALAILEEERQRELAAVPFFDGLIAGELDALVESFAGEPEPHHPTRGRIRGAPAFEAFVIETHSDPATTLRHYVRLTTAARAKAVAGLDEVTRAALEAAQARWLEDEMSPPSNVVELAKRRRGR